MALPVLYTFHCPYVKGDWNLQDWKMADWQMTDWNLADYNGDD